ncbi:hypothetical protein ACFL6S_00295 [Candidatus Poribacteria bacterium]
MFKRLSVGHIIIIALLVVHLLPVWVFRYFPTQDGASHIYNSYVLKEYHKHENYRLREVYKLNLTPFPNWTSHAFIALLMYVFPPIVCEKILLSICIALLPLSLFYFLNGVQKGKTLFGLIGFVYTYNYLLHMGFYNFVLSMSLFFFTLGYWWRHRDKLSITSIGVIYVLLLITYLTHYQSYATLLLSLTFFAIFLSFYEALQKTWRRQEIPETNEKTLVDSLRSFAAELKPTLFFLGAMLPAYFIMMSYYLDKTIGYGGNHKGFEWLRNYFFSMKSLVSFRDDHILIGRVLLVVLAIAFLLTFIDRVRQIHKFRSSLESNAAKEHLWTKIVIKKDQFLIMAVVLTVMYFRYPWSIGSGGGWINDRIHLYIFLVLLPFFSVNLHRYINYAMAGIIIALSLWHLGYNINTYYLLNRDIKNAVSWPGTFEKHTILTSRPDEWNGLSDSLGWKPKYVEPFGHVEGFLALENGIAYLDNYEAETDHFPINYRDEDEDWSAEYVVVWRTEYDDVEDLQDDYDLIHSNDYNRLYRLRKAKPDEDLWGGKIKVEFDMQSQNGQTSPDHFAVYGDTIYTDGRYGWLTRSERNEFLSKADIPEPYKDSVWSEEDGVFRVALPNGEYEVTCYFCSGGSKPLEINLIANGEKRIKKLRLPTGNETVAKSYKVIITDERLTQVIYTRRKGSYQRWAWSGCTIERIND